MAIRIVWIALFIASLFIVWFFLKLPAQAREGDDHGNHGVLKSWFDGLKSGKGMCCSFADGIAIDDPDVEMAANHYRVRIDGEWVDVPDSALVTVPNRFGQAVVWPFKDSVGHTQIRCFMPGAGT